MAATAAIALGANLGRPADTLAAVRPRLEALIAAWRPEALLWSPQFRTAPVGGPAQPDYLNAALLIRWPEPPAGLARARDLLAGLQALETAFGRERGVRWGPRSLDLDLLWFGACTSSEPALQLPHPRLARRSFVLAPLAAIDPGLSLPDGRSAALALAALPREPSPPQRLPGSRGWPE
ncbi:2-amino-4-hydroxy-6-hydroxymethyldihydropteridine diphosphokinase [Synechococcus sp. RSCCF101]|uniref:2-amino-4-hydroxy-6- hydroxymethyldihydropteridine diphosphokinase n=1 Tax=Synechococcus sp. RSCCF101 TaxID=2511069 RepID=UPI001CD9A02E|nr:2-amino-4-hydroxy-6-hydroxymethyldihydropteridine diphosphokinase [Synechococcus sp. RSCCF101]